MTGALDPGATFAGRYRIDEVAGRGGMGIVYRATDVSLDRPVALKLIVPELAGDEHFRRRFLDEPRRAASLDHPNVIPIYDAGEHDGQLYLAMRFVEGRDLGSVLAEDGRLAPDRTMQLLGQVAAALDSAHARGLVHRDVKPGNVMLDERGHPYLTDFGVTKQSGGASTGTGHMVGTLDYLAPEQIRGEDVDARTDVYALACVLYHCLAGRPPFRRASEAETLWAHMQEEPPALPGQPRLAPALHRGLAKEKDERYGSCGELIAAAGRALGVEVSAPPRARRAAAVRAPGGHRAMIAAVAALLVVAAAAAVVVVNGDEGSSAAEPTGSGIAVIDPGSAEVSAFVASDSAPGNIAIGEGAVWALRPDAHEVLKIDPETKRVTGRLVTRGVPTDVAVGEGAVWVGNGGSSGGVTTTVGVSRFDPRTLRRTRTVKLPDRGAGFLGSFNWGFPRIAFTDGAVWVRGPDERVSRLDARTGSIVATLDAPGAGLASGAGGVWTAEAPVVRRIDPATNRVAEKIRISTPSVAGIAVGGGAVWVAAERQGVVWRIDPGPAPETRTIEVGPGVSYVAYGDGAVWVASYIDGTVARIDPTTNEVTARVPIPGSQALAVGDGGAWVSSAGGSESGELPAYACDELESAGGGEPDVLVASDLPLQGPNGAGPRAQADAIRTVFAAHDFRAGRYRVGYRSCDDSTAQTGAFDPRRCAANANAFAHAEELVAVIGPYSSYCAQIQLAPLNRAPGGPIAVISPTTTYAGLTRDTGVKDPNAYRGEPDVYYPTGIRHYMRLLPGDDLQGGALALLARQLGLRSIFVVSDGEQFSHALVTYPFRRAAAKLGLRIAGSATFAPHARSHDGIADRVARSGADGVVLGGDPFNGGGEVLKALRSRLRPRVPIMSTFLYSFADDLLKQFGSAAVRGLYVTTGELPKTALPLTPAGRRLAQQVGAEESPYVGLLETAYAAELVLKAIERSDGTRQSVLDELWETKASHGPLGPFQFDENGDIAKPSIAVLRVVGRTSPGRALQPPYSGAVVDRLIKVPTSLID